MPPLKSEMPAGAPLSLSQVSLTINDILCDVASGTTIADWINAQGFDHRALAVAINQAFIPRSLYATTVFESGQVVDVLHPMQGG